MIMSKNIEYPINILRPIKNGRHFADDASKCIFLNENIWISIAILLMFVPRSPINNIPPLVQKMAWRRPGNKSLLVYWRTNASLGFNELNMDNIHGLLLF